MAKLGDAFVTLRLQGDQFSADLYNAQSRIQRAVSGMQGEANRLNFAQPSQSLDNFGKTVARIQRSLLAFAAMTAIYKLTQGFNALAGVGLQFNKSMETSRLGIASVLSAMGEFTKADGERLSGIEKINAAQAMTVGIMNDLQKANLQTMATMEQLVRAYQETLGPAMAAGFDVKQVKEYTVAMVQAAGTIGISLDQLAEETRSLLTGAINPRTSRVATALGITPDDIRAVKDDVSKFFPFLMGKLDAFVAAGQISQRTIAGIGSNIKDIFAMSAGEASAPFFDYLKQLGMDIIDEFTRVNAITGDLEMEPAFVQALRTVYDTLQSVTEGVENLGRGLFGLRQRASHISDVNDLLYKLGEFTRNALSDMGRLASSFGVLTGSIKGLLDSLPAGTMETGLLAVILYGAATRGGPLGMALTGVYALSKAIDEIEKKSNVKLVPHEEDWKWLIDSIKEFHGLVADGSLFEKIGKNMDRGKLTEYMAQLKQFLESFESTFKEIALLDSGALIEKLFEPLIASIAATEEEYGKLGKSVDPGHFRELESASVALGQSFLDAGNDAGIFTGKMDAVYSASSHVRVNMEALSKSLQAIYSNFKDLESLQASTIGGTAVELTEAQRRLSLMQQGMPPGAVSVEMEYYKKLQAIDNLSGEMKNKGIGGSEYIRTIEAARDEADKLYDVNKQIYHLEEAQRKGRQKGPAALEDVDQSISSVVIKLKGINDEIVKLESQAEQLWLQLFGRGADAEIMAIEQRATEAKAALDKQFSEAAIALDKIDDKLRTAVSGSTPEAIAALEAERAKFQDIKSAAGIAAIAIDAVADAQIRLAETAAAVATAQAKTDYVSLTGTMRQQLEVQNQFLEAQRAQALAQAGITEEQAKWVNLKYDYQERLNTLRATGGVLDGIKFKLGEMAREAETSFDLGARLAEDFYSAIGGVFESVISGERDIEAAFADMGDAILAAIAKITAQKIVIPVIFQSLGLDSVANTLAGTGTVSGVGTNNSGGGIGGAFLSGGFPGGVQGLGYSMYGYGGIGDAVGEFLVNHSQLIGSVMASAAGAVGIAGGIKGIMDGNYIGGSGSIVGGALMLASMAVPWLAPIGAAVTVLSNLLGNFINFNKDKPGIRGSFGFGANTEGEAFFQSRDYGFNVNARDIGSEGETQIRTGLKAYFEGLFSSLDNTFNISVADIMAQAGSWTMKYIDVDESDTFESMATKITQEWWNHYTGALQAAVRNVMLTDYADVMGLLTERGVKDFEAAFDPAKYANVDEFTTAMNTLKGNMETIADAIAAIDRTANVEGLSDYEWQVKDINDKYDVMRKTLEGLGVDVSKTNLELARQAELNALVAETANTAAVDWIKLSESIQETMDKLTYSPANPANASDQLKAYEEQLNNLTGGLWGADLQSYLNSLPADEASTLVGKIQEALQQYLDLAQGVYDRPSFEYEAYFDFVTAQLEALKGFTNSQAGVYDIVSGRVVPQLDQIHNDLIGVIDAINGVPGYASGGYVAQEGLYRLHPDEWVVPNAQMSVYRIPLNVPEPQRASDARYYSDNHINFEPHIYIPANAGGDSRKMAAEAVAAIEAWWTNKGRKMAQEEARYVRN